MNTNTGSQGIPYLGKEGGAGSTSSTLNMLTRPVATFSDCLVGINKDGNVNLFSENGERGAIVSFRADGTLFGLKAPLDMDHIVYCNEAGPQLLNNVTDAKMYVVFNRGRLTLTNNVLPFDQTGFIYNTHSGTTETISYKQFGTGHEDIARGDHKHNADGTTASSNSVDIVSSVTWNGTQLVIGHQRMNFSNGIFVGTTSLADTTINTVTYNPS